MQGTSFNNVTLSIPNINQTSKGALLITHWGISGPAVLKLSAWAARELCDLKYKFELHINWLENLSHDETVKFLKSNIMSIPKKNVKANALFGLSNRFWNFICEKSGIVEHQTWAEMGKKQCLNIAKSLTQGVLEVDGKGVFKEEFVTAGGVALSEVDNYKSKLYKSLYFVGEVLNIDGITGGFNFQAAWTSAWHVSEYFAIYVN